MCRNGTPGLLGFSFLGNKVKKRKTGAERRGAAGNLRAHKNQEPSELSWIRWSLFLRRNCLCQNNRVNKFVGSDELSGAMCVIRIATLHLAAARRR